MVYWITSTVLLICYYYTEIKATILLLSSKKKTQVKSSNSEIYRASKENLGKLVGWDGVQGRVLKVGNAQLWFKVGEKLSRKQSRVGYLK